MEALVKMMSTSSTSRSLLKKSLIARFQELGVRTCITTKDSETREIKPVLM
jgi:hypothetical protein